MKLTFVTPRYGPSIIGGAEQLVRSHAEYWANHGHTVHVLTTCAVDHTTWENILPMQETVEQGVHVHRFPVSTHPDPAILYPLDRLQTQGLMLSVAEERIWFTHRGESTALLEAIAQDQSSDWLIFCPYITPLTTFGAIIHPNRSIIIPCIHDEPAARSTLVRACLEQCAGLFLNSSGENDLLQKLGISPQYATVLGVAMASQQKTNPEQFRTKYHITEPFLAYAGRMEVGKGFPLLVSLVAIARETLHRPSLHLVALGSGHPDIPKHDQDAVRILGPVDRQTTFDCFAAATATVTMSTQESFSYLIMESWQCQRPVIVNGDCAVTSEHCRLSNGGLWIHTPAQFAEAVRLLIEQPELASNLGLNGATYVKEHFGWETIADRMLTAFSLLQDHLHVNVSL